ncbi:hypothetical protein ACWGIB_11850 [Streptomyces xiamenensis]
MVRAEGIDRVPAELRRVVTACLVKDAADRPDMSASAERLSG